MYVLQIAYGFWKKRSTVSSVCSLSCEKKTGILIDKPKREKPKTVHTPENIAVLAESVCEAPSTLIHRRSQQLNISETSLRRILHKHLGRTPYKVQFFQELKPIDHPMRFRFAKWTAIVLQKMPILAKKNHLFRWSSFWSWRVCKQAKLSPLENPHAYIEKPTHLNRVTVWCGFWFRAIIGPFFVGNELGEAVTVNGDR